MKRNLTLILTISTVINGIQGRSVQELKAQGDLPKVGVFKKRLNLSGKGITGLEGLGKIAGIKRIRILSLEDNQLTNTNGVDAAENLWALNLAGNVLTEDGLKGIAGLKHLKILILNSNQIADISPEILDTLPKLKFIALHNNPITAEQVTSLKKRGLWISTLPITRANIIKAGVAVGTLLTLILTAAGLYTAAQKTKKSEVALPIPHATEYENLKLGITSLLQTMEEAATAQKKDVRSRHENDMIQVALDLCEHIPNIIQNARKAASTDEEREKITKLEGKINHVCLFLTSEKKAKEIGLLRVEVNSKGKEFFDNPSDVTFDAYQEIVKAFVNSVENFLTMCKEPLASGGKEFIQTYIANMSHEWAYDVRGKKLRTSHGRKTTDEGKKKEIIENLDILMQGATSTEKEDAISIINAKKNPTEIETKYRTLLAIGWEKGITSYLNDLYENCKKRLSL